MNDFTLALNGAYIELTSSCNAKCPYCYNESGYSRKEELPKEAVLRIIDEISRSHFPAVVFSGGEPFLYSYINEAIEYALFKDVKPTIITNGFMLDKAMTENLLSHNLSLQLTFDSAFSCEHDKTRGEGNFEKLTNILSIAYAKGCENKLMIRFNVSKDNYERADDFISFLREYGIKGTTFSFLHRTGRGKSYPFVFDMYRDSILLGDVLEDFYKKQDRYRAEGFEMNFGKLDHVFGCAYFADGKIEATPRIDTYGNVFPCQIFTGEENVLGNILDTSSLVEILHSDECNGVIERIRGRKGNIYESCKKCPYDKICMGGCPAVAYSNMGDLCTLDSQCYFIKYTLKNSILLTKDCDGDKQ